MNTTNKGTITVITTTVAIMAFSCVFTICMLSYLHIEITKDLSMITTGLVGALTGMLVQTRPTSAVPAPITPNGGAPTAVEVVNQPTNPVPTKEGKL